jgi:hypothetical protein
MGCEQPKVLEAARAYLGTTALHLAPSPRTETMAQRWLPGYERWHVQT